VKRVSDDFTIYLIDFAACMRMTPNDSTQAQHALAAALATQFP
jgi:hypothetical protein